MMNTTARLQPRAGTWSRLPLKVLAGLALPVIALGAARAQTPATVPATPGPPAASVPSGAPEVSWPGQLGPWTRASGQPVIRPAPEATFADPISHATVQWEALHTFNPAAVVRGGKVYVLYRAEDNSGSMAIGAHVSRLGLAVSDDGIHFRQMPGPVLFPDDDAQRSREVPGGVEDPRVVEAPDGTYVLSYTQWSRERNSYSIGIATSPDLQHWTKHGPAFAGALGGRYDELKYKSAGIVTERHGERIVAAKIDGRFWMYWGEIEVGLATSTDLIHWTPVEDAPGKPKVLLRARPGLPDSALPEVGPPPLHMGQGILLLYNAKNAAGAEGDPSLDPGTYSVEEALFSDRDLTRLLGRTTKPVFAPSLPFERSGQYAAGTTFAEGLVFFRGQWWLYYGCADSFVGVATAPSSPPK